MMTKRMSNERLIELKNHHDFEGYETDEDYTIVDEAIAEIDRAREAEKDLEERLDQAKYYSPFQAKACPLCKYENGVFKMHCNYHENITMLEKENADLKEKMETLRNLFETFEVPMPEDMHKPERSQHE